MLVIRNEQMKALNAPFEKRFIERTVAHLRQEYPELTLETADVDLQAFVRETIPRSVWYGIEDEDAVLQFLELELTHGPLFELQPDREWAAQLLDRDEVPSRARLAILRERLGPAQ